MSDMRALAAILAERGENPDDPVLRRRTATVTAVSAPSCTISVGGTTVAAVRSLVPVAVGDVVEVVFDGARPLIVGAVDSGWHVVGDAGEPAFTNSWTHLSSSYEVQFRKVNGIVYLGGLIAGGTDGTFGFTLPAGYRIESGRSERIFVTRMRRGDGVEQTGDVRIATSGGVKIVANTATTTWMSLDGISFPADQ